ncbi:hypothetical protein L228DRAFT_19358 [Xylona heveae TC161]|uniref:F-box domain-containing protein n=1 Tax=Xylona heveae (strain CBS 132557 / TC161) TaxID=1328760 RepID=A0A165JZS2_XYLHT|nr:hypothetical protein L228DRAFT_19358 [Xylona heveae TC161]KZF26829.1 hypothetical protein L228DRAFT_19358 [Xylona heveae TC161]
MDRTVYKIEDLILILNGVLMYLQVADRSAMRLTCRTWSAVVNIIWPVILPSVFHLPREIVQMVYVFLSPLDFNSARHTCHGWMLGSLDRGLLALMLKRAGFWSSIPPSLVSSNKLSRPVRTSQEWNLSKVFSFECSLLPGWTGNGISTLYNRPHVTNTKNSASPSQFTGFFVASTIDFTELASGLVRAAHGVVSGLTFTVSACGRFVVVAEGCVTYIYRLTAQDAGIQPFTSVSCPARVLAVSMDTSSERFAIAVLLDGRMGLVCEVKRPKMRKAPKPSSVGLLSLDGSSKRSSNDFQFGSNPHYWTPEYMDQVRNALYKNQKQRITPKSREVKALLEGSGIGRETGPHSIYRNLCSNEDPPRSVAVCPSRRCVAFGCSAGVELHWVDAVNQHHLSRWFPLNTPGDFLHFVPCRKGEESTRRLRLISSMAHPYHGFSIKKRYFPSRDEDAIQKLLKEFRAHRKEGNALREVFETENTTGRDHFRAVPLSDGKHILYTDPVSNRLCIGVDTPLVGPTKLQRRITLIGEDDVVPTTYNSWYKSNESVRVVAGYGDNVWFFSIPSDVFADFKNGSKDGVWRSWVGREQPGLGLRFKGKKIGRIQGLVDVAIRGGGKTGLIIWGFGNTGVASVWKSDNGGKWAQSSPRDKWVQKDGQVVDASLFDNDDGMQKLSPLFEALKLDEGKSNRRSTKSKGRTILSPHLSHQPQKTNNKKKFTSSTYASPASLPSRKRNLSDSSDGADERYRGRLRLPTDLFSSEEVAHLPLPLISDLSDHEDENEDLASFCERMDIDGGDVHNLTGKLASMDLYYDPVDTLSDRLAQVTIDRAANAGFSAYRGMYSSFDESAMDIDFSDEDQEMSDDQDMSLPDMDDVSMDDIPELTADLGSDFDRDGDVTMTNGPWGSASSPFTGFGFGSNGASGLYQAQNPEHHPTSWVSPDLHQSLNPEQRPTTWVSSDLYQSQNTQHHPNSWVYNPSGPYQSSNPERHPTSWVSNALFDGGVEADNNSDEDYEPPETVELLDLAPNGYANGPVADAAEFQRLNCEMWGIE